MGTTSTTTAQSLREIEQSAPAVGAKILCLFLSLSRSEFGALLVRGDIILTDILSRFLGRLGAVFSFFKEEIALSDALESFHFRR